jgi:hypothetical protein
LKFKILNHSYTVGKWKNMPVVNGEIIEEKTGEIEKKMLNQK